MANIIKILSVFALFCFSLLQINCASAPVYRLQSEENSDEWYYGRKVITKEDNLASVKLTFEDASDGNYTFYLDVQNTSDQKFTIDPSNIYLETYKPQKDQEPLIISRIHALDPEARILKIDKEINSANSSENTRRGVSCFLSAVDLVGTVATVGEKKSKEEVEEKNRERENRQIADENAENDYDKKLNDLNNKRDYWQNDALRKITISPDQKAGGFITIPIAANALFLRVVVEINSSKYFFNYKQETR
ncbi:MAG: hypothetical protein Q8858_11335 [Bacteroidota bacterium]|nr:hypothetical protein [Bacteroidota bacterium]MDP4195794.1 hypothetical protein [Bacteroidota bacterium]